MSGISSIFSATTSRLLTALLFSVSAICAPALAGVSPLLSSSQTADSIDLGQLSTRIDIRQSAGPIDPLAPFRLSLGSSVGQVRDLITVSTTRMLQAHDDHYLHAALTERREDLRGGVLPAPAGLRVLDGDLFFHEEQAGLVQASLLLEATSTKEHAITTLESWLGKADFEIVLPGSLNLVIGWHTPTGYMMGTFSDLPVFQLSAFPDEPTDLLAGSQIVLYEGLAVYSRGIAEGAAETDLLHALQRVVHWVESTRSVLQPVN